MALGNIHLTPQLVQAVRDAIDILDIASEHTRLRKGGRRYTGLCPLHREKTPSFSVDQDRGLFYCFGCGRGGDAIKLYMLLSGDDFPAAIESLARRYGIPLPAPGAGGGRARDRERSLEAVLEAAAQYYRQQLERSGSTLKYLEQRQMPKEIINRFGLGFAPDGWRNLIENLHPRFPLSDLEAAGLVTRSERSADRPYDRFRNRLVFPIWSVAGRLVGFGGRTLGDDPAKYINTAETEQFQKGSLLYGLHASKRQIRESGVVLLVEGYFDVLGAVASGIESVVASMGTALTIQQAQMVARYAGEVIIGYDGDAAGEEAARRALPLLLEQGLTVRRARFGTDHDPDSLRLAAGGEAVVGVVREAPDAIELEFERLITSEVHRDPRRQAGAARQVTELLKPIPDSVLRYSYCRQAAGRLGIPTELLWRRLGRPVEQEEQSKSKPPLSVGPVRSLEEKLLQLLLAGEEELPPAGEFPPPEAFLIPACRNIYQAFFDLYRDSAGMRPAVEDVLASVPFEGDEVDQVARLLLEGTVVVRAGELKQALRQVERRWLQQQLRRLAIEISDAQRSGDAKVVDRLLREKNALSQTLHGTSAAGTSGID